MEGDSKPASAVANIHIDVGYDIPTYNEWSPMAKEYHPLQAGSIDGTDTVAHDRAVIRAIQARYRPNKSVTGNPRKTLFIGRLTRDTTEDQVGLSNSVAVTLPLAQNWIEAVQVYVKENYPQLQCQVWHEEEQHCIVTRKMLSGAQQVIIAGTGTAAISLDITSKDTIRKIFSDFGKLESCRIVRDIVTGLSRGYAFVEYENEWDARSAWKEMHKAEINGAIVIVEYEAERNLKGWIPRRLGGGWGGKKESGQLRFGGRDRQFRRPLPLHATGLSQKWGGSRDNKRDFRHDNGNHRGRGSGRDWGRQGWRREERDRRSNYDNYRSQARDRDRDRRRFVE